MVGRGTVASVGRVIPASTAASAAVGVVVAPNKATATSAAHPADTETTLRPTLFNTSGWLVAG